jgi:hypothetical protein
MTSLVERSSGHFTYAATVIGYIRSDRHRPDERLKVVLRHKPDTQLDSLYPLIFQDIESHDKLEKSVSGHHTLTAAPVRGSGMGAVDVIFLLFLSLVATKNEEVRILHKPLIDYPLDPTKNHGQSEY